MHTMTRRLLLGIFLVSLLYGSAYAGDKDDLKLKIEQLNQQSIQLLGLSINAVKYLLDADPNSYRPLWYLEQSGEIAFIRELEKTRYVTVQIVEGLPDGSEKGKFVRIIPADAGIKVQRCVAELQTNIALKQDK